MSLHRKWRAEYIGRVWNLLSVEERWLLVFGTTGELRPSVDLDTVDQLLNKDVFEGYSIGRPGVGVLYSETTALLRSLRRRQHWSINFHVSPLGRDLRTHGRRRLRAIEEGS